MPSRYLRAGRAIALSPREFDVLYVLAARAGEVVPRSELLERFGEHATLTVEQRLIAALGVEPGACAFVGDDLPDLAIMRRCGLAVAVANAVDEVKAACRYTTRAAGGSGAVREICDLLLRGRPALIGQSVASAQDPLGARIDG